MGLLALCISLISASVKPRPSTACTGVYTVLYSTGVYTSGSEFPVTQFLVDGEGGHMSPLL